MPDGDDGDDVMNIQNPDQNQMNANTMRRDLLIQNYAFQWYINFKKFLNFKLY